MPTLILLGDAEKSRRFPIKKGITTIGSGNDNDIILEDSSVSAQHCRISFEDGAFYIEDMESEAGTIVNKIKVNYERLREGDKITIGRFGFEFSLSDMTETEEVKAVKVDGSEQDVDLEDITPIEQEEKLDYSLPILVVMREGRVERQYNMRQETLLIGREKACDIRLNDKLVSARHARIKHEGGRYYIEDLNSSNGTFVDGKIVQSLELSGDNDIKIGGFDLRFYLPEGVKTIDEDDATDPGMARKEGDFTEVLDEEETGEHPKLVIVGEKFFGSEFPINKDVITIGREVGNDIIIQEESISRTHAIIYHEEGRYWIQDQDSLNGVKVNGELVGEADIKHGDEIIFGSIVSQFVEPGKAFTLKKRDTGDEEEDKKPVNKLRIILIGVAAIFVLILGGNLIVNQLGPDTPSIPIDMGGKIDISAQVYQYLNEAKEAHRIHDWEEVAAKCNAILEIDPQHIEAMQLLEIANREKKNRQTYKQGKMRIEGKLYLDGAEILKQIPETSVYYSAAQSDIKAAINAYVQEHIEKGDQYMAQKQYSDAIDEYNIVLRVDPTNTDVIKKIDQAELAMSAPDKKPKSVGPSSYALGKRYNKQAMSLYLKGDAQGALKEYKKTLDLRISRSDPLKQEAIEKNNLINEMLNHLQGFKKAKQQDDLSLAGERAIDLVLVDMKIAPQKNSYFYKTYAETAVSSLIQFANQAMASGDTKGAYRYYMRALKIEPDNMDALNGVGKIDREVKAYYREGYILEPHAPQEALTKYMKVLEIAPPEHEYYKKATKRIDEIRK